MWKDAAVLLLGHHVHNVDAAQQTTRLVQLGLLALHPLLPDVVCKNTFRTKGEIVLNKIRMKVHGEGCVAFSA